MFDDIKQSMFDTAKYLKSCLFLLFFYYIVFCHTKKLQARHNKVILIKLQRKSGEKTKKNSRKLMHDLASPSFSHDMANG